MLKLYKYRPLSEFLFKELYYQEIYFASYSELNDPLDLSARIEFTPKNVNQLEILLWYLFKTTLILKEGGIPDSDKLNNQKLIEFSHNDQLTNSYKTLLFDKLIELSKTEEFISLDEMESVLYATLDQLPFRPAISRFKSEIARLARKFLENSHATCFSETNDDFLMWSHYASKHSGICLEFTLENGWRFPYIMSTHRGEDQKKYLEGISHWQIGQTIYWERIRKVVYQEKQPHINFFDFAPVFHNEFDCDLIGLTKPWTHEFAFELEHVFSTKTLPWKYEKEWRAIDINFGDVKQPEERINHYPIECLTGIYFGIRTSEAIKKRIHKTLDWAKHINYYSCIPTSGRILTFEDWEYYEE